jgi:tetratricopeptide (TPR) repeat protein
MDFVPAVKTAREAAAMLAATEGRNAAADYLALLVFALNEGGFNPGSDALAADAVEPLASLARLGLEFIGARRDTAWVILRGIDLIRRELDEPDYPGITLDSPERREFASVCQQLTFVPGIAASWPGARFGYSAEDLAESYDEAARSEKQGRLANAALAWTRVFRFHTARGEFAQGDDARRQLPSLLERIPDTSFVYNHCTAGEDEWRLAHDEDWDAPMFGWRTPDVAVGVVKYYRAPTDAAVARTHAHMGRAERALRRLARTVVAIEKAPGWAENYVRMICDAAATLWLTERTDFVDVIERNLRAKIVIDVIPYPMMDGRLALARVCALQGRTEEASDWFGKARTALETLEARPLRAIVDFDESLMLFRRGGARDRKRARPLLAAAVREFRAIGMTGDRRAEAIGD